MDDDEAKGDIPSDDRFLTTDPKAKDPKAQDSKERFTGNFEDDFEPVDGESDDEEDAGDE